jgi:hypothetical protein
MIARKFGKGCKKGKKKESIMRRNPWNLHKSQLRR